MTYETILLEKDATDAFAVLTLNRPQTLNSINKTVIREIVAAVRSCVADPAINALVITGAGRDRRGDQAASPARLGHRHADRKPDPCGA